MWECRSLVFPVVLSSCNITICLTKCSFQDLLIWLLKYLGNIACPLRICHRVSVRPLAMAVEEWLTSWYFWGLWLSNNCPRLIESCWQIVACTIWSEYLEWKEAETFLCLYRSFKNFFFIILCNFPFLVCTWHLIFSFSLLIQ